MDLKEHIKNTFMTSLHKTGPHKPFRLPQIEITCENRLKLYKLLQEAAHDFELYSSSWVAFLVEAISKAELVDILGLLNIDKTSKLEAVPLADSKPEPVSDPVADSKAESLCSDVKKLNISDSVEEYFVDDENSRFLFGLIASSNDELKKLFIRLEIQWLQLKFILNVPEESMAQFLRHNGIELETVPKEEVLRDKHMLKNFDLDSEADIPTVFKLPFPAAPKLIINKTVSINKGIVYFPNKRTHLSVVLEHTASSLWKDHVNKFARYWLIPVKDERIEMIIEEFMPGFKRLLHYTGEVGEGILTLKTIDEHSFKLFPLCMSEIQRSLKENSHLKHFARLQYAVFLKNAGLPYEDAMELFETEFTKKMSEEEYRKNKYNYYFSHCYGKVGGLINYPAQSCEEVLENGPSGGNQEHGCPFAHADEKHLTAILHQRDVKRSIIIEILDLKRNKQYRKACCVYFKEKIDSPLESVSSPNDYYVCALENKVVDIEDIFKDDSS